jgi:hypothetical protein
MARRTQHIEDEAILKKTKFRQDLQLVDAVYCLTYNDKFAKLRVDRSSSDVNIGQLGFKYKRHCWGSEGTAKSQVEKLNKLYKTKKFNYRKIT